MDFLSSPKLNYWVRRLVSEEDSAYDPSAHEDHFYPAVQGQPSLISYEGLSGEPYLLYVNQTRNADRLARLFPDASIIIGIRRQDTLLLSLFLLFIMHGGSMSLKQFLGYKKGGFSKRVSLYGRRINMPMFEFGHIAGLYADRFSGRVHFLVYEHMSQDIAGYVRNVCNILGEPEAPDFRAIVRNQAFGNYQYLLARILNPWVSSSMNPDGLIPAIGLPGRIKHPMNDALRHSAVNRWFDIWPKNKIRLPDSVARSIMEYYSPSNAVFEQKWGLGLDQWGYLSGELPDRVDVMASRGA